MSYSGPGGGRPSKNERREAAREKAKALRDAQKKKDRRNRFILQGSIGVAVLAIAAIVVLVISSGVKPPQPGPLNMLSDGVKITKDLKTVRTPAQKAGESPVASVNKSPSDTFDIRVYVDYYCPICGAFEAANAAQIKDLVNSGIATLEIHPISILDRSSLGTQYSTRAANSAACVANYSPDSFFDYSAVLFQKQPQEGVSVLTDSQLVSLTKDVKVKNQGAIANCIKDQTFSKWVTDATNRALDGPIPGTKDITKVAGTPTVLVNGQEYKYTQDQKTGAFNPQEFAAFLLQVAGKSYTQEPTPSPSPSVTSSPSPSPSQG